MPTTFFDYPLSPPKREKQHSRSSTTQSGQTTRQSNPLPTLPSFCCSHFPTATVTAQCRVPTANCALPTVYCSLPNVFCPLSTAYCYYPLPTAHCSMSTAHCYCPLPIAKCPRYTALCLLSTAFCSLLMVTVQCPLPSVTVTANCPLCTARTHTQSVHSSLPTANSVVHAVSMLHLWFHPFLARRLLIKNKLDLHSVDTDFKSGADRQLAINNDHWTVGSEQ